MGTQTRAGKRDVYMKVRVHVQIIVPLRYPHPEPGSLGTKVSVSICGVGKIRHKLSMVVILSLNKKHPSTCYLEGAVVPI
jgi:hypothetical protein